MYQTSTLWEDLFRKRPPEGESITILLQQVSIEDGPPEVEEIVEAVRKLQSGRVKGPSGMKAEHLTSWLWAVTTEKEPDTETWDKVVSVIQVAFW